MSDMTIRRPLRWDFALDTNVGVVRKINEDSIWASPDYPIWAVADGMGGYEAGNVASNMIVKTLEQVKPEPSLHGFVDAVEDSLLDVNTRILEYADIMLDGRTLGSTVVTLLIKGRVGVCLWAGDSRLYRIRNGKLSQISRDHSQVEELIQQGFLLQEDAAEHPDSNVITRAIGVSEEVCIDITAFDVQLGDTFLLCSDGLYNMVSRDDINEILVNNSIHTAVELLIQMALDNGATDNVSVVLVKGEQGSDNGEASSEAA
jgi:serine/threonine protein phosphatase PrpC